MNATPQTVLLAFAIGVAAGVLLVLLSVTIAVLLGKRPRDKSEGR